MSALEVKFIRSFAKNRLYYRSVAEIPRTISEVEQRAIAQASWESIQRTVISEEKAEELATLYPDNHTATTEGEECVCELCDAIRGAFGDPWQGINGDMNWLHQEE